MSFDSIVPPDIWAGDKVGVFTAWLRDNVPNPKYRKYVLIEWAKTHSITLTGQMVTMAGVHE